MAKDAEDGIEGSRGRVKKKIYIYIKEKSNQPFVHTSRARPRGRELTTCGHVSWRYLETINQRMAYERCAAREKYDAEQFLSVAPTGRFNFNYPCATVNDAFNI